MDVQKVVDGRPGFMERIRSLFKRPGQRRIISSRFYDFIKDLDRKDPEYHAACKTVALCDEALDIVSTRVQLIHQLKAAERSLIELKCYENITDESAKELKLIVSRLKHVNKDRAEAKNQLLSFDPGLEKMADLEDEAREAVGEIKDAEHRQKLFSQDMHYLKGEKLGLESERESLIKYEVFTRRFMTVVLVFFIVCATMMAIAAVSYEAQILVPISVMTILVIVVTAMLYGFRRRVRHELKMNEKKQKKALGMLNTKSAVVAHYTNFLDFTYRKYKVRNSDMLHRHIKEFDHYRHLTRRYDALRKQGDEMETELMDKLTELKIPMGFMPADDFARSFNLEEKRDMYKTAASKKKYAEDNMAMLDERQAKIWDNLTALNRYEGSLVDRIISRYVEEASKVILGDEREAGLPIEKDN